MEIGYQIEEKTDSKGGKGKKIVIYSEVLITFSSWHLELERYGN